MAQITITQSTLSTQIIVEFDIKTTYLILGLYLSIRQG